jgi:hypothetical protein
MFRRAAFLGLALTLAGCTETVLIHDAWDGGSKNDAATVPTGIDSGSCPKSTYQGSLTIQQTQLWILLDRSFSMQAPFDGTTRQAAVQTALKTTIPQYEGSVDFGFEQFPAGPNDPVDCPNNKCCAGSLTYPTPSNWYDINTLIECDGWQSSAGWQSSTCDSPSQDSPSYAALAQLDDYFNKPNKMMATTGYILLVTSSDPSCAADSSNLCSQALNAAEDLANTFSMRTLVLDVGSPPPSFTSCLAQIGGMMGSGPNAHSGPSVQSFYNVSNQQNLGSAIDDIVSAIAQESCTVDLTNIAIPYDHSQVTVSLYNGKSLVQSPDPGSPDANGWTISADETSITFSGSACKQIESGAANSIRIKTCSQ